MLTFSVHTYLNHVIIHSIFNILYSTFYI